MSAPDPGASTVAEAAAHQVPEVVVFGLLTGDRKMSMGGLRQGVGFTPSSCGFNHEIASIFKRHDAWWVDGLRAIEGIFQSSDLGLESPRITAVVAPLDEKWELFPAWLRPDGAKIAQGRCIPC